jgi:AcrR family transcriptional regulator
VTGQTGAVTARQDQAAATRERILDAAIDVLVEEGYVGASTLRIQQRVGLSRGGLLHQFGSRDELLVAAVNHLATARVAALRSRRRWPTTPARRIDAAVKAMWVQYRQPFFWASVELWLAARHSPVIAEELAPRERELGQLVRESADSFFGDELAGLPSYPALIDLLITSMRGVGLTYAWTPGRNADRDPHLSLWTALARHHLLDEAFHSGGGRTTP